MTDPAKINKRKQLIQKYVLTFLSCPKEAKDNASSLINREFQTKGKIAFAEFFKVC